MQNNTQKQYNHYVVKEPSELLAWLMENLHDSRTKIKATLSGKGIKVNGKIVTQFDYPLVPGMKIAVSKTKQNNPLHKACVRESLLGCY